MTTDEVKETKWYDAWIRWERGSKEMYNDDDDDDDHPPIPTETYSFSYMIDDEDDEEKEEIEIELQGFSANSEAIWSSTGLTLWRSSEYLCNYLVQHRKELLLYEGCGERQRQRQLLELGSGLGQSGILARFLAPRNQWKVLLTDGDTDTLSQLRNNVQLNLRLAAKNQNDDDDDDDDETDTDLLMKKNSISCHQLIWGKESANFFKKKKQLGDGGKSMDIIMGSDLVYVPSVIEPLFQTVETLLCKEDGIFLMAHCARRHGNEVTVDMVLDAAHRAGFLYEILRQEDDIYLFQFRWARED
eukprot:scaffold1325_cov95-Cylindrotheca_fusiformis.AAC.3